MLLDNFKTKRIIWIVLFFSLVPFSIGDLANIPSLKLYEIVIPLYFFGVLVYKLTRGNFSFKKSTLHLPIFIFSLLLTINYFRNPLFPANLLGLGNELGGFRWFYTFLLCLMLYFLIVETLSNDKVKLYKVFKFIFKLSFVMCIIGILMYIIPFSIPGLDKELAWNINKLNLGQGEFVRVGFLGVFAQIGFIFLLSYSSVISRFKKIFYSVFFVLGIIISGSRSVFLSTAVVFLVWCLAEKRYVFFWIFLFSGFLFYLTIPYLFPYLPNQLKRLFNIFSLETIIGPRYYSYKFFFEKFLERPVLGVGFGKEFSIEDIPSEYKFKSYIITQARSGGHGTYISLLYTMGLFGLISYLWILKRAFTTVVRQFLKSKFKELKRSALFLLLWFSATTVNNFFGGMGWSLNLYLILGFIIANYISIYKEEIIA